jgi:DNA-binding GntR family transcriptional regulator
MLKQQAYARFKERLFAGELRPGQFVSQRELSEVIGLPIAPVRDALRRLAAESLVHIIPQRGVRIAEVDVTLIRDAIELRSVLECHAAQAFVEQGDFAALAEIEGRMQAGLERARDAFDEALADEALALDDRFHALLIEATGNAIMRAAWQMNHDRIRLIRQNNRFSRDRLIAATEEHLAIVAALRRRDPLAAASAVRGHLQVVFRRAVGLD